MARSLVICPSERKAQSMVDNLLKGSWVASVLSRNSPVPSPYGVICATSIVDVAVTIDPPPSALVDTGEALSVEPLDNPSPLQRNRIEIVPTCAGVAQQRVGRVGRTADAIVVLHDRAGTGPTPRRPVNPYWYFKLASLSESLSQISGCYNIVEVGRSGHLDLGFVRYVQRVGHQPAGSAVVGWGLVMFLLQLEQLSGREAIDKLSNWLICPVDDSDVEHCIEWVSSVGYTLDPDKLDLEVLESWLYRSPFVVNVGNLEFFTFAIGVRYATTMDGSTIGVIAPLTMPHGAMVQHVRVIDPLAPYRSTVPIDMAYRLDSVAVVSA